MTTEFEQQVIESLAELKTQMKVLVGNGQPGFIQLIDARVDALERDRILRVGERRGRKDVWALALSALTAVGGVFHMFLHRA